MATFFGEILPVTSRAFEDDDDEEEDDTFVGSSSIVFWSKAVQAEKAKDPKGRLSKLHTLIIAQGPAASGFIQTYVMEDKTFERVAGVFSGISDEAVQTLEQLGKSDETCYLHRSTSTTGLMVCQCKTEVKPDQSFSWVTQLFSGLDLSECYVCVLASTPSSDYKSDVPISELQTPFLRALKTARFGGTPVCPILEQPNMVTGLQAQILTYCQVHSIRAVLYLCYTESMFIDIHTITAFKPLLKATPIKDFPIQNNPKAEKMLLQIVKHHQNQNLLYI
ncbi:proteasome assembly chaperone 1-like [Gigantopelta aegis]|uniref:proteasome assembly chaperone 1-like n=1 Tax=Gigantopelta aegis TaxID=1735272 RepID=UPI001B88DB35|nr:proteasome assembly chaperone 1-like [Gigantopelta aegis]